MPKKRAIELQKPGVVQFFWREHGEDNRRRVWRSDWAGDMFEILTPVDFRQLKDICARFSIPLNEVEDED